LESEAVQEEEQVAGLTHPLGIDVRLGQGAAAEQRGDFVGVDLVGTLGTCWIFSGKKNARDMLDFLRKPSLSRVEQDTLPGGALAG
jgi:hypothetical protein